MYHGKEVLPHMNNGIVALLHSVECTRDAARIASFMCGVGPVDTGPAYEVVYCPYSFDFRTIFIKPYLLMIYSPNHEPVK